MKYEYGTGVLIIIVATRAATTTIGWVRFGGNRDWVSEQSLIETHLERFCFGNKRW